MGKICDKYCHSCLYYHGGFDVTRCCNYLLWTEKMRGCPPGKGCTKKKHVSRAKKQQMWRNIFEGVIDKEWID